MLFFSNKKMFAYENICAGFPTYKPHLFVVLATVNPFLKHVFIWSFPVAITSFAATHYVPSMRTICGKSI